MSNFTDFFPAAGGGGFTKMNKYSTNRAFDDATHKLKLSNIDLRNVGTISAGSTSGTFASSSTWLSFSSISDFCDAGFSASNSSRESCPDIGSGFCSSIGPVSDNFIYQM